MRTLYIMEAAHITAGVLREEIKPKPKRGTAQLYMARGKTGYTILYTIQASRNQVRNSE